jgi:hypothetical protein
MAAIDTSNADRRQCIPLAHLFRKHAASVGDRIPVRPSPLVKRRITRPQIAVQIMRSTLLVELDYYGFDPFKFDAPRSETASGGLVLVLCVRDI